MENIEALFLKINIYAIAPFIVGFLMLILGLVTFIRDRASKVSSSFFFGHHQHFCVAGFLALALFGFQ